MMPMVLVSLQGDVFPAQRLFLMTPRRSRQAAVQAVHCGIMEMVHPPRLSVSTDRVMAVSLGYALWRGSDFSAFDDDCVSWFTSQSVMPRVNANLDAVTV